MGGGEFPFFSQKKARFCFFQRVTGLGGGAGLKFFLLGGHL